jgi:hypothetical protein
MTSSKMCPKKQDLTRCLRHIENEAQREATALSHRGNWLSVAYYGLGILSATLAAVAATTALAEYTLITVTCAGIAAIKTSAMVYLRTPCEKALAERLTAARFIALRSRAYELRIMARDTPVNSLEQQTVRFEAELELLRLSPYAPATPFTSELSVAAVPARAQASAEIS